MTQDAAVEVSIECFKHFGSEHTAALGELLIPQGLKHNAKFDFSDEAIPIGVRMHCEIVRSFVRSW